MDVTNYWWVGAIDTFKITLLWGLTIMGVTQDLAEP